MRYSGAEIIIRLLERAGVTIVSGIPGGANLPLYDALSKSPIRHILARHEQGAGFIAHGIARSTGKPGVCFATSGPGATNLVTAQADAKLDSVPVIAITGQVPTSMIGTDAFQEVDTYGMTLSITKHNFLVKRAEQLLTIIPRAFAIALSGRPGPVLIDVPKDVQLAEVELEQWPAPGVREAFPAIDRAAVADAAAMIARAKRPVIYAGGGVIRSGCHHPLQELARKNGIPVALTLMGLGAFPPDDPLCLGMLGMHGSPLCNIALDEADLVLALGSRFDDRAVGRADEFCRKAAIIHVDVDAAEIHKIRRAHLPIVGDLGLTITALLPLVGSDTRHAWLSRLSEIRAALPCEPDRRNGGLHPIDAIKTAHSLAPAGTIVCTDVGQHQMWVAQAYPFATPGTFLTSGGLGTMGFGLPAAIGAALANPGRRVLCISGDGSFQMNIQELATLTELGLPVTILLLNNGHLGLVRQQQELFYGGELHRLQVRSGAGFCGHQPAIRHSGLFRKTAGVRDGHPERGHFPRRPVFGGYTRASRRKRLSHGAARRGEHGDDRDRPVSTYLFALSRSILLQEDLQGGSRMKRVLLIGLLAVLAVSMTMAVPSYSRAHGGWGAGWFVGGLALGTALGFARPYYYPPPAYYYPPPAYAYPAPAPAYAYPPAYASPPAPAYAPPPQSQARQGGAGEWVTVPGQDVNGTWVPEHKAWVPRNR